MPAQSYFNPRMITSLMFALMLSVLLVIAMMTDAARFIIPNWLNGLIAVLYGVFLLVVPEAAEVDYLYGLYGFGIVFTVGYILFIFNIMGGGDVKLLGVLALWAGLGKPLLDFVLITAVLGGVLTLALLFGRLIVSFVGSLLPNMPNIPRVLSFGEPLPYGLAIATGFLAVLWMGDLPGMASVKDEGLALLASFYA